MVGEACGPAGVTFPESQLFQSAGRIFTHAAPLTNQTGPLRADGSTVGSASAPTLRPDLTGPRPGSGPASRPLCVLSSTPATPPGSRLYVPGPAS